MSTSAKAIQLQQLAVSQLKWRLRKLASDQEGNADKAISDLERQLLLNAKPRVWVGKEGYEVQSAARLEATYRTIRELHLHPEPEAMTAFAYLHTLAELHKRATKAKNQKPGKGSRAKR